MSVTKYLGLDKLMNLFTIVRQNGGIRGCLYKMYRQDEIKDGVLVGEDKYGNKYYQNPRYFQGRSRWIEYNEKYHMNYDGSQLQNLNLVTAGSSKRPSDSESSHPKKKIRRHEVFEVEQNFEQKGDDVIPLKFDSAHDEETVKNIHGTGGSEFSSPSKSKLKGQLRFCKEKIVKQSLKIKRLQSKNRRLKKILDNVKEVLLRLEEKCATIGTT